MPALVNRAPDRASAWSTALTCGALVLLFFFFAAGAARADFSYVGAIGAYPHNEFLHGPSDVALDASGNLYVSDVLNNRVRKFSAGGAPVSEWPVANPSAITVAGGTVLVASFDPEAWSASVKKYTPDGQSIGEIPLPDAATGIAADGSGNIYASQSSGHVVKVASSGALTWTWPAAGTLEYVPRGLAINPADGNLWVATATDESVQLLSPQGNPVKRLPIDAGAFGNKRVWPFGVAFGDGYAWITDSEGDCCTSPREGILKVDPVSGAVVAMYGNGSGRDGDLFDEPWGIEFAGGSAYVADHGSDRVVRWGEPLTGDWGWSPDRVGSDPPVVSPPIVSGIVVPADMTAPTVRLSVSKQRLRDVRKRGLIVRGNVSESATVTATVQLDNRTARKLRLTRGRKPVTVARATVTNPAGRVQVRAKLTRKAANALRRSRTVKLTVTLSATDLAGNASRPLARTVTLR